MVTMLKKPVRRQRDQGDRCHRCGGLMVAEQVVEHASFDWRCVSCGERIDAVILAHRKQNPARIHAETLFLSRKPKRG